MARLPVPGSDNNNWGDLLNEFLKVSHNGDGGIKPSAVTATGLAGSKIYTGAGAPFVMHNNGDLYIDTTDGDYYQQASGAWGAPLGNLTGPQGEQGEAGAAGAAGGGSNNLTTLFTASSTVIGSGPTAITFASQSPNINSGVSLEGHRIVFDTTGTYLISINAIAQANSSASVFANLAFSVAFEQQHEEWLGEGWEGDLGEYEDGWGYSWADISLPGQTQFSSVAPQTAGFTLAAPVSLTQMVVITKRNFWNGGDLTGRYRVLLNNTSNVAVTLVNPILNAIKLD